MGEDKDEEEESWVCVDMCVRGGARVEVRDVGRDDEGGRDEKEKVQQ